MPGSAGYPSRIDERMLEDPRLLLHYLISRTPKGAARTISDFDGCFVPMERKTYVLSSHLNRHVVTASPRTYVRNMGELLHRNRELQRPAKQVRYIFHSAFCASTLLANCLEAPGHALTYREPAALTQVCRLRPNWLGGRSFSTPEWKTLVALTISLLSKTFYDSETPIIKACNLCSTAIGELLSEDSASGVFMYSDLKSFLCSALKSRGRRAWVKDAYGWTAKIRWLDDGAGAGAPAETPSDVRMAVHVWNWQMRNYLDCAKDGARGRIRSLDVDTFLARTADSLSALNRFFGLGLTDVDLERLTASKAFRTYSKDGRPNPLQALLRKHGFSGISRREFDAGKRARELEQIARLHATEIAEGLAYARELWKEFPIPQPLPDPLVGEGDRS